MPSRLPPQPAPQEVHSWILAFESTNHKSDMKAWINAHPLLPIGSTLAYLAFVFVGPKVMSPAKAFDLRSPLVAWNTLLSLFSLAGVVRMTCFLWYAYWNPISLFTSSPASLTPFARIENLICTTNADDVTAFWGLMFTLSKIAELGDTVWLVLRKRRIIFLHWYHHTTVLLFTWFSAAEESPLGAIFAFVNYFVHSLMYAYFAVTVSQVWRPPRLLAMAITGLQITQMLVGLTCLAIHFAAVARGIPCATSNFVTIGGLLIYASYFALFVRFFVKAYLTKQRALRRLSSSPPSVTPFKEGSKKLA